MQPEHKLVSDVTVFSKYARFWGELGRRETFEEIVARNRQMHLDHADSGASWGAERRSKKSSLETARCT